MKNLIIILSLLLVSKITLAQNLTNKISENAAFVVNINGEKLFNSVSQIELENSLLFKELVHEFFRHKKHIESLTELGVDFNNKMCLVVEQEKDVTFFYYAFYIKDVKTFEDYLKRSGANEFLNNNGVKSIKNETDENIYWQNNMAIFLAADYTGEEFAPNFYDYDYEYYEEAIEETYQYEVEPTKCEEGKCETGEDVEIIEKVEKSEEQIKQEEAYEKYRQERIKKQEERKRIREEKERKKKALVNQSIQDRVTLFFQSQAHPKQISLKGIDQNANANFWLNTQKLDMYSPLDLLLGYRYRYGRRNRDRFNFYSYFGSQLSANLYLTESEINIKSQVYYSDKLTEVFEKVYASKIDKSFVKYVSNSPLAYVSMSFDSENLLHAYGDMATDYLEKSDIEYGEGLAVYAEFLSILIDEKELSELATGDALFVMHDIVEREYTYTSYEYDDNFEYSEVKKTKKGMMPEMTLMIGSERLSLFNKFMDFGVKQELLTASKNFYTLSSEVKHNDLPFDLYFQCKDDIVFVTNSKIQLANIALGKAPNKIKGQHKKQISKYVSSSYVDFKSITEKLLMGASPDNRDMKVLQSITEDLTEMTSQTAMKNGVMESEMKIAVPDGHKNAGLYLLSFIDKVIREAK